MNDRPPFYNRALRRALILHHRYILPLSRFFQASSDGELRACVDRESLRLGNELRNALAHFAWAFEDEGRASHRQFSRMYAHVERMLLDWTKLVARALAQRGDQRHFLEFYRRTAATQGANSECIDERHAAWLEVIRCCLDADELALFPDPQKIARDHQYRLTIAADETDMRTWATTLRTAMYYEARYYALNNTYPAALNEIGGFYWQDFVRLLAVLAEPDAGQQQALAQRMQAQLATHLDASQYFAVQALQQAISERGQSERAFAAELLQLADPHGDPAQGLTAFDACVSRIWPDDCPSVPRPSTGNLGERRQHCTVWTLDICGYSATSDETQCRAARSLHYAFYAALDELPLPCYAHLVAENTWGDAVMAAFTDAVAAVTCLHDVCATWRANADGHGWRLSGGIHQGPLLLSPHPDHRSDVFGEAVNVAARLQMLAQPHELVMLDHPELSELAKACARFPACTVESASILAPKHFRCRLVNDGREIRQGTDYLRICGFRLD